MSATMASPVLRRAAASVERKHDQRVMFRVTSLWGVSRQGLTIQLGEGNSVDSGALYSYLDPDADRDSNIGVIDFESGELRVRYGFQIVCPRLLDLAAENCIDPSLLMPVRVLNTEECALNPDRSGWRAKGTTKLLPGGNPLIGIGGG